jgi:hypothetical protein
MKKKLILKINDIGFDEHYSKKHKGEMVVNKSLHDALAEFDGKQVEINIREM